MRLSVRLLILALGVGLVGAGTAQAALTDPPAYTASPFTKATPGAGNTVTMTFNYGGTVFSPTTPQDHAELSAVEHGNPPSFVTGPVGGGSIPFFLLNGHLYDLESASCQIASCSGQAHIVNDQTTRIDATPPSGTVQIDGGAVATNSANVTLNVTATDPLIDGIPGSSSGVAQLAVDRDGDGSYPCSPLIIIIGGNPPDNSGCGVDFAPTVQATIPVGDGLKTVGVEFGDGARPITTPCKPPFCFILFDPTIQGNVSAPATDTIILDTAKPIAQAVLDRTTIQRGETVSFDDSTSTDQNPAIASGVDPTTAVWDFKDGTPPSTGQRVTHVFATAGTFIGQVTVKDRAGNVSDPRSFSVTVNPRPGDAAAAGGSGSVGAITSQGTAAFRIDRVKVNARYSKSRLKGSITLVGTSTQAGTLRADLRPTTKGGKVRHLSGKVGLGAFTTTLKLPADVLPGTYKLDFVGPGGTLNSSLKLTAPREGVLKSGKVSASPRRAVVLFTLAAQPAKALRGKLSVSWRQGSHKLGLVKVRSGARITAALPGGVTLGKGKILVQLRAGGLVVGDATGRLR